MYKITLFKLLTFFSLSVSFSLFGLDNPIDPTETIHVANEPYGEPNFVSSSETHAVMVFGGKIVDEGDTFTIVASVEEDGEWSDSEVIVGSTGAEENKYRVASNSDGSLVVYQFYDPADGGTYEIRGIYYDLDTNTWGASFLIQTVSSVTEFIDLCGDDDGFGLVWNDHNIEADDVVYTSFSGDGITWSARSEVDSIDAFENPTIGKNESGYLIAYYRTSDTVTVYTTFSSDEGTSWSDVTEVADYFHSNDYLDVYGVSIFGNINGFFLVGIHLSGYPFTAFSDDNGETWNITRVAENIYPDEGFSAIDITGNDFTVVVSIVNADDNYATIYASPGVTQEWSEPVVIDRYTNGVRTTATEEEIIFTLYVLGEGNDYYASYSDIPDEPWGDVVTFQKDNLGFFKRFQPNKPKNRGYINH